MSYYRNNYGYIINYPVGSHKFSNQNQILNPTNNFNMNYSQNKPPSNFRNKKKLSEIGRFKISLHFSSEIISPVLV